MSNNAKLGSTLAEYVSSRLMPCPPSSCQLWIGGYSAAGYGYLDYGGKRLSVHRVVWELFRGPIPPGMNVCHHCDVPPCGNPDHLFLGTHADNRRDCTEKGRAARGDANGARKHPETRPRGDRNGSRLHPERLARGDKHGSRLHPERMSRGSSHGWSLHPELTLKGKKNGSSKLTDDNVREIRKLWATGLWLQRMLAERFGVTKTAVGFVVNNKTWKHVQP